MDKELLKRLFQDGYRNISFVYDTFGMTSGVGHVRIVLGSKHVFTNREEFFKEVMLIDSFESTLQGMKPWRERTNFDEWIESLEITDSTLLEHQSWLLDSLGEVKANAKDWSPENTIDLDKIELPGQFKNIIKIKENEHPRFYINTYTGFISEDEENFFFLEDQFES